MVLQSAEQPSPDRVLPSSHSSSGNFSPSPQGEVQPSVPMHTGSALQSGAQPLDEATREAAVRVAAAVLVAERFLLPGDLALARFEDELSQQWPHCNDGKEDTHTFPSNGGSECREFLAALAEIGYDLPMTRAIAGF